MSSSPLDTKDRRSFEHSRQKTLHPSDRHFPRTTNAWKHKHATGNSRKHHWHNVPQSGTKWLPSLTRDDVGVISDLDYVGPEDDGAYVNDDEMATPTLPQEVSLTDLIRPARQRKGIAHDYELVPRVRPVMIIDEGTSGSGSDSDSNGGSSAEDDAALDWELIPETSTSKRRQHARPTYASVMRASK